MKFKILFFFLPFIVFAQNSFLKDLWIGDNSINNQNFSLSLHGVIYQSEERKDEYMGFQSTHFFPIKDLNIYIQEPINMSLGSSVSEEEFNTYFLNNFKKINGKSPSIFPVFEFLKGKLLTVQNTVGSKSSKDFLFSFSFNNEFPPRMIFNITEESENGSARTYQIPTKFINGNVFLLFSNEILYRLGFECSFSGKRATSINRMYKDNEDKEYYYIDYDLGRLHKINDNSNFNEYIDYSKHSYALNYDNSNYRVFNKNYIITLERKKDLFSDKNWFFFPSDYHVGEIIDADYSIRDGKYFFLFELIEQE